MITSFWIFLLRDSIGIIHLCKQYIVLPLFLNTLLTFQNSNIIFCCWRYNIWVLEWEKNQTGIQLETWSIQFSFFLFSFFYILCILDKNLWSDMLFIYIGLVVTQKCGPIFTLCDGQRVGGCSNYWQAKFHVVSPNSAFDCLILLTLR